MRYVLLAATLGCATAPTIDSVQNDCQSCGLVIAEFNSIEDARTLSHETLAQFGLTTARSNGRRWTLTTQPGEAPDLAARLSNWPNIKHVEVGNGAQLRTKPVFGQVLPSDGTVVEPGFTMSAQVTAGAVGVKDVTFLMNASVVAIDTAAPYATKTHPAVQPVEHRLSAIATSKDGETAHHWWKIRTCEVCGGTPTPTPTPSPAPSPDRTPPKIVSVSPTDGATVNAGFTIKVSATDNRRVRSGILYIDGQERARRRSAPPWTFQTAANRPAGDHNYEIVVSDGTNTVRKKVNFTIAAKTTEAPTIVTVTPGDGDTVDAGFPIEVTATDAKGVTKVVVSLDGEVLATKSAPPWKFQAPASLADGEHQLLVEVHNQTTSATHESVVYVGADNEAEEEELTVAESQVEGGCMTGGGATWLPLLLVLRRRRKQRA